MQKKSLFETMYQTHNLLSAWHHVKQKGSLGGIDGVSVADFEDKLDTNIKALQQELIEKKWQPQPYLKISIPKKENERRVLGLLCIKDKIVQQAIRQVLEPRFEKSFVSNSYGYRPGKGHTKAVRYAFSCFHNKKYPYVLRLDIDNYFDTVDHEILFKRAFPIIADDELFRLVKLCVKMGMVTKNMKWNEVEKGVPQGAILSPMLSNFYLHPFDQFVLTRTKMYVRYADDFLIFCTAKDDADNLLRQCSVFLSQRLKLQLNTPSISETKNQLEFLGVLLDNKKISISKEKKEKLASRIQSLQWEVDQFDSKGIEGIKGIVNYYVPLLQQNVLSELDGLLLKRLKTIAREHYREIQSRVVLQAALKSLPFFAEENVMKKSVLHSEVICEYLSARSSEIREKNEQKNKKLISQRKREYRRRENESSELVISSYGTFIGISNEGITVRVMGKKNVLPQPANLKHITVLCGGVSMSSNALEFCMRHNIGVDFFTETGKHYGSFVNPRYMHTSLWEKQTGMSDNSKSELAVGIITGKIKNQVNLIKYFHKYHKGKSAVLSAKYEDIIPKFKIILSDVKSLAAKADYRISLVSLEARSAELYWDYVRELISDDVEFSGRERKGAADLVNCLLNYGYSILYARIWQMVLFRKLNPTISVIHVEQLGKPTLVYDIIELFRAQAVDRVVISLVQKREPLKIQDGYLDKETKKLLVQNVTERINRHEKYRNKEIRLCDIINLQVKEIADYIENGTKYKPYVAKW